MENMMTRPVASAPYRTERIRIKSYSLSGARWSLTFTGYSDKGVKKTRAVYTSITALYAARDEFIARCEANGFTRTR